MSSAVLLAVGAAAHDVQFGLVGLFKADKFVLSKAAAFDHETSSTWQVTDRLEMNGQDAWLAYFTKKTEDGDLLIDKDGLQVTIPLATGASGDQTVRSQDFVKVTIHDIGDDKVALVSVPDHFKDVWRTFHTESKAVVENKQPSEWEEALAVAWRTSWETWDNQRVYTLMFAHGMGNPEESHTLKIMMQGQEAERKAKTDLAWFATSVPRSGEGSSSFKVSVDEWQTDEKKFEDTPSKESARCTTLEPRNQADSLKVFVAAFSNKKSFDTFKETITSRVDQLWDTGSRKWLFDEIIAMCSELDKIDIKGAGVTGAGGRNEMFASPVHPTDSRVSTVAEDEAGPSLWMVVGCGGVAAVLLLIVVWWFFCRGSLGRRNRSDATSSSMEAPDIHGEAWEMDGANAMGGSIGGADFKSARQPGEW